MQHRQKVALIILIGLLAILLIWGTLNLIK
ncbi:hypothetical protein S101106_02385 [Levilactobacillus brevis]|uniref:Uncharacterized protein n=1 Tax=Levilactobacillus brevis (strain ATCC 367 / BCRC 12310 / CIP 105137 / JCM 1170 / LMG 11437 / NCIMB 947 / NCTC 947) TaxID=387344 RepID=Q03TY6_LEVBA|nr:hypothetical protein LVIS_0167 [Levilactobacillus brevis ATCC 367]ARW21085.1 hypothetical protein S101174_00203 [Levilactobacillus brevis]ARW51837.1 hypothetical protein S101106_02385 [Levilactobacillus brevis]